MNVASIVLWAFSVGDLPAVNASLNAMATVLLIVGYRLIRNRREVAHRRVMVAAFMVSVAFLACYVTYHLRTEAVRSFPGGPPLSYLYYTMLISHVVLAATVPWLAIATIYLGYRDRRSSHRRLARWTYPIWLYVSATGVVIYLVLYQIGPAWLSG